MYIEELINIFIEKQKHEFTFEDVKSYLPATVAEPDRIITDILEESEFLFTVDTPKTEQTKYLPRHIFFSGSSFLVSPTDDEIEDGILIPGHRFIPFYNPELFPCESFDIIAENDEIICTKHIEYKIEDLYKYHALLGAENIVEHFIADNPANKELIGNPSNKISISVFDFKDFYEQNSFSEEDLLKFTVKDWSKGIFTLKTVKKEEVEEKEVKNFMGYFEERLQNVFDTHGQWLEIPEQLALAFHSSNKKLLESPCIPLEIFVELSDSVQIKYVENNTILWHPDKEEDKSENATELLKVSNGNIESIDSILEEISPYISSIELIAFIKDSLFNDINEHDPILERCFPDGKPELVDAAQKTAFYNHFEELFEEVAENYIREDNKVADLRAGILNDLENFYSWFDNIIKNNDIITENEISSLKQNILYARRILQHINNENLLYSDEEEFEQLDNLVFGVLSKLNEEIENIDLNN